MKPGRKKMVGGGCGGCCGRHFFFFRKHVVCEAKTLRSQPIGATKQSAVKAGGPTWISRSKSTPAVAQTHRYAIMPCSESRPTCHVSFTQR